MSGLGRKFGVTLPFSTPPVEIIRRKLLSVSNPNGRFETLSCGRKTNWSCFLLQGIMSGHKKGRTLDECQDMINRSFQKPMVKFLREKMAKAGCSVGDDFFHAVNCQGGASGGYMRGYGIDICSNEITMQDDVNQVVIHELVHAYDDCQTANLQWENCAHHACSEIRAGHLSGDCHFKRELLRIGFHKLRGHGSECVKRRVMKSVMSNPHCSEAAAREAMEAVWDTCYNDTRPFDRAP